MLAEHVQTVMQVIPLMMLLQMMPAIHMMPLMVMVMAMQVKPICYSINLLNLLNFITTFAGMQLTDADCPRSSYSWDLCIWALARAWIFICNLP